jgi:hypothetical protein
VVAHFVGRQFAHWKCFGIYLSAASRSGIANSNAVFCARTFAYGRAKFGMGKFKVSAYPSSSGFAYPNCDASIRFRRSCATESDSFAFIHSVHEPDSGMVIFQIRHHPDSSALVHPISESDSGMVNFEIGHYAGSSALVHSVRESGSYMVHFEISHHRASSVFVHPVCESDSGMVNFEISSRRSSSAFVRPRRDFQAGMVAFQAGFEPAFVTPVRSLNASATITEQARPRQR